MRGMIRLPDTYKFAVESMPGRTVELGIPPTWEEADLSREELRFFFLPCGARVGINYFGHDGHIWIHTSISRRDSLPSYDDLCQLKTVVFGKNGICAQVFEAEEYHVNIHPNCLHLWGPNMPSIWPLPRFTEGTI